MGRTIVIINVYRGEEHRDASRAQASAAWDQTKRLTTGRCDRRQDEACGCGRDKNAATIEEFARSAPRLERARTLLLAPDGNQMIERRRAERCHLVDPGVGTMRMVQDIEIVHLGSNQAVVIAAGPLPRGERLLLEIPVARHSSPCTVLVRVIDNRVVMDDGSLRRQVRLQPVQRISRGRGFLGVTIPQGRSIMGALIRRVPVRIMEASTAGCVFESPTLVIEGAVGFVQMRTSTEDCSEAVRVRRTSQTFNAVWQYRMAAEFLTLGPTSPQSLRGLATVMTVGPRVATHL
jgi:hypothetical protein